MAEVSLEADTVINAAVVLRLILNMLQLEKRQVPSSAASCNGLFHSLRKSEWNSCRIVKIFLVEVFERKVLRF